MEFFLTRKKSPTVEGQLIRSYPKFDFTADEGKEWLNYSREKNQGKHCRRKVEKICATPAEMSTSLTSRINGTTHVHINWSNAIHERAAPVTGTTLRLFIWCPWMAINVRVQYNGGLLPDIILFTQCYHHRGTRLNDMKRFCFCSL